jgi:hypothetical protein
MESIGQKGKLCDCGVVRLARSASPNQLSLLFNHRGCFWGTKGGWRSGAPLLAQGGH